MKKTSIVRTKLMFSGVYHHSRDSGDWLVLFQKKEKFEEEMSCQKFIMCTLLLVLTRTVVFLFSMWSMEWKRKILVSKSSQLYNKCLFSYVDLLFLNCRNNSENVILWRIIRQKSIFFIKLKIELNISVHFSLHQRECRRNFRAKIVICM